VLYHGLTRRLLSQLNVEIDRVPDVVASELIEQQRRLGMKPREAAVVIATVLFQEFFHRITDSRPQADQSQAVVRVLGTLRGWRDAGRISGDLHRWAVDTIEEALTVFANPAVDTSPADRLH
jgi:hypothetical protein